MVTLMKAITEIIKLMEGVFILIRVGSMRELGLTISSMERVLKHFKMGPHMKGSTLMAKKKDMEFTNGLRDLHIVENG